ncbi:uncharacterized protein LOC125374178 [Haliotis rufescens]|uniref:uncharacterized protein LOC125374178 n=1 Tax=Haliotis rufescens TaxID=6454 RepID=UPI00201EAF87|nr:uncharacterized protein LOC125374178 [Haliotis rufescens]XP_048240983.1 uncharacterized protein LOC125374178 [Haliotis rufescens]XP_048240984.1 uncharacterized protein LOC125374178 [Haliotis rufescens]XP_048240985.1 uncharacterized protein LOC125374178 [Haliotis rufescens]XP_048240986.1 uncharacterized protein LOC125374178 [Haliotis rufescens]XP_048240987.1 uncharacterized protein LOC125374178 [Haliotis rufescens]XP_048240988.1 uncharacterized protein LOC125374178 [Haliotis rufescens]XP_0
MDRKYVIAIVVCATVIVVIIVIVVVVGALLFRRRRRVVRRQPPRPQSSVSVERTLQVRAAKNYRISRDDIEERSGKDDLELKGVNNSPTGEAITAMCPPTPPVGGAAPPRLDPI